MTQQIPRKQAWCKLVMLMVDERLPDPLDVTFDRTATVVFDSMSDLAAWVTALGATFDQPFVNGAHTIYSAAVRDWHGWYLTLDFHIDATREAPSIAEDLSSVREVAEHGAPVEEERTEEPTGLDEGGPVPDFAAALSAMADDPQYREAPQYFGELEQRAEHSGPTEAQRALRLAPVQMWRDVISGIVVSTIYVPRKDQWETAVIGQGLAEFADVVSGAEEDARAVHDRLVGALRANAAAGIEALRAVTE